MGLDVRSVSPSTIPLVFCYVDVSFCLVDASPNFPNATIFNDSPTSGFGGWGDPADDYQITTGALADSFKLAYPVPHGLRRNYTTKYYFTDPFGDGSFVPTDDLWTFFTPASRDALVNGFVGDFMGFQALFESFTVSRSPIDEYDRRAEGREWVGPSTDAIATRVLGSSWRSPPNLWRVRGWLYLPVLNLRFGSRY